MLQTTYLYKCYVATSLLIICIRLKNITFAIIKTSSYIAYLQFIIMVIIMQNQLLVLNSQVLVLPDLCSTARLAKNLQIHCWSDRLYSYQTQTYVYHCNQHMILNRLIPNTPIVILSNYESKTRNVISAV